MSDYEKVGLHRPPPIDESDASDISDIESNDEEQEPRTSVEVRRHDQGILDTEEEAEKLLTGRERASDRGGLFRRSEHADKVRISDKERRQYKREARREGRKSRRRRAREEESELMYDMEEGGHRTSGESSGNSSDIDRQKLEEIHSSQVLCLNTLALVNILLMLSPSPTNLVSEDLLAFTP